MRLDDFLKATRLCIFFFSICTVLFTVGTSYITHSSETPYSVLSTLNLKFMTHTITRPPTKWQMVSTGQLCVSEGICQDFLKGRRVTGDFIRNIHYIIIPGTTRIQWNRDLVRDWFVNAGMPAHQVAIDRYLNSLPSSENYQPAI